MDEEIRQGRRNFRPLSAGIPLSYPAPLIGICEGHILFLYARKPVLGQKGKRSRSECSLIQLGLRETMSKLVPVGLKRYDCKMYAVQVMFTHLRGSSNSYVLPVDDVIPPSTTIFCPVMYLASSDTKNKAA